MSWASPVHSLRGVLPWPEYLMAPEMNLRIVANQFLSSGEKWMRMAAGVALGVVSRFWRPPAIGFNKCSQCSTRSTLNMVCQCRHLCWSAFAEPSAKIIHLVFLERERERKTEWIIDYWLAQTHFFRRLVPKQRCHSCIKVRRLGIGTQNTYRCVFIRPCINLA